MYARSLRRAAPDRPDFKLFTGHRGVGKTSELYRLKALLEKPEDNGHGFVVVFCDVSEGLDVNDMDFPDLLVFVAAELQRQLGDAGLSGFTPETTYLKKAWKDIQALLGREVELTGVDFKLGFVKLTAELRNRPSARKHLREAVEQHSTSLLKAVNDLLGSARTSARVSGYQGLVLIVDGLDKLVYRQLDDGASNTHDRLFIDRGEQLASLDVHTIYTVPISLIYSPQFGQLEQTGGEHHTPVSMIRLRPRRDQSITRDSPGMVRLREMVANRATVTYGMK